MGMIADLQVSRRWTTDFEGFLDAYQELSGRATGSRRVISPRRNPYPDTPQGRLMRAIRQSERDFAFSDLDMIAPLGDEPLEHVILYRDTWPKAIIELKTTWESRPGGQQSMLSRLAFMARLPSFLVTWDGDDPKLSQFEWLRLG